MEEFLETCAQVEHTMCRIYRQLADSERDNDRARALWLQMAKDEADHATQLRFARCLPEESFSAADLSQSEVETLLIKAQALLDDLEETSFSSREALKCAISLEEEFMRVHAKTALVFTDEKLKKRFDLLARADEEHIGTLREYFREIWPR